MRNAELLLPFCIAVSAALPLNSAADSLSITNIYPAPNGSYVDLRSAKDSYFAYKIPGSKVGIGTLSPSELLTVDGDVYLQTDAGTTGFYYNHLTGQAAIGSDVPSGNFDEGLAFESVPSLHGCAFRLHNTNGGDPHIHFENYVTNAFFELGTWGPGGKRPAGTFALDDYGPLPFIGIWPHWPSPRPGYVGISQDNPNTMLDIGTGIPGTWGDGDGSMRGTKVWSSGALFTSDGRFKTNVETLKDSLNKILNLRAVSFNWNEKSGRTDEPGRQIGVIAQELQKEYPELVSDVGNGYLGVDYSRLSAALLEAVKEQQHEIDDLSKRIHELKK